MSRCMESGSSAARWRRTKAWMPAVPVTGRISNQMPCTWRDDADGMYMRPNTTNTTLASRKIVPLAASNAGFIHQGSWQLVTAFWHPPMLPGVWFSGSALKFILTLRRSSTRHSTILERARRRAAYEILFVCNQLVHSRALGAVHPQCFLGHLITGDASVGC